MENILENKQKQHNIIIYDHCVDDGQNWFVVCITIRSTLHNTNMYNPLDQKPVQCPSVNCSIQKVPPIQSQPPLQRHATGATQLRSYFIRKYWLHKHCASHNRSTLMRIVSMNPGSKFVSHAGEMLWYLSSRYGGIDL